MMHVPELIIGSTQESDTLDFKEVHWKNGSHTSKEWQFEMAKDIAAMANSRGGFLILGAAEKDEKLIKFIDPKLPKKWESTFREVIATWIHPEPVVDFIYRTINNSSYQQLIIQVDPALEFSVLSDPRDGNRRFCLPIRRGSHTVYVPPLKAISMLSSPHRRIFLRFEEIAEKQRQDELEHFQLLRVEKKKDRITKNDIQWRIWKVQHDLVMLINNEKKLVLPYERVETIYPLNDERTRWRILIDGSIMPFNDESHGFGPYLELIPL